MRVSTSITVNPAVAAELRRRLKGLTQAELKRLEAVAMYATINPVRTRVRQQWVRETARMKRGGTHHVRREIPRQVRSKVKRFPGVIVGAAGVRARKGARAVNVLDPGGTHPYGKVMPGHHVRLKVLPFAEAQATLFHEIYHRGVFQRLGGT